MLKVAIIIPTFNGGEIFKAALAAIQKQSYTISRKIVIDSSSTDGTPTVAKNFGFEVYSISPDDFDHGYTRQKSLDYAGAVDIVIFITQDSVLCNHTSIERLVDCFKNTSIGAVYGRQLPQTDANPIAKHARLYNYPGISITKSSASVANLGIKTVFLSNSFAAYQYDALMKIGGFPTRNILGEDMYVAAKLIMAGWNIMYCAEAQTYHSHNYGIIDEFKRYFDTGVFHRQNSWILQKFGQPQGEGKHFVLSEILFLWNNKYYTSIPQAMLRTVCKLLGYRLGLVEHRLPKKWKTSLSMNKKYWKR